MDQVMLTNTDKAYLIEWGEEHENLLHQFPVPFRRIELVDMAAFKPQLTAAERIIYKKVPIPYFRWVRRDNELDLFMYTDTHVLVQDAHFELLPDGRALLRWSSFADALEGKNADVIHEMIAQNLCIYIAFCAYTTYAKTHPEEADKELVKQPIQSDAAAVGTTPSPKRCQSDHVTYLFRNRTPSAPVGVRWVKHSPPGCEYSVRGHYRHYKSGKIVWIAEQVRCKGRGPRRSKRYKVTDPSGSPIVP